jgi:hypothetical protein
MSSVWTRSRYSNFFLLQLILVNTDNRANRLSQAGGGVGLPGEFPHAEKSEHYPTSGRRQVSRWRPRVRPEAGAEVAEEDESLSGAAAAHVNVAPAELADVFS